MKHSVQTGGSEQVGAVETVQDQQRQRALLSFEADHWLCAFCLARVARERDRFSFNGRDEFTFTNPGGLRFDIITFNRARSCRESGQPTLEHTWFPGHAWSFCECAKCGVHLGWFYSGTHQFAGLIKNRIVRAATTWN